MIKAELPLLKEELMKDFGYISFQLVLANIDVIGVRIKSNYEVVVIQFRGAQKVGFIYEGGNFSAEKVFKIYQDVPEDYNDLEAYEKNLEDRVEILRMPKNNYVFVSDKEVKLIKK